MAAQQGNHTERSSNMESLFKKLTQGTMVSVLALGLATAQASAQPQSGGWHAPMLPPKSASAPPAWHAPMLPPKSTAPTPRPVAPQPVPPRVVSPPQPRPTPQPIAKPMAPRSAPSASPPHKVELKDLRPHFDYTKPPSKDQIQWPTLTPPPEPKVPPVPRNGGTIVPDGQDGFHGGAWHTTKDGTIIHGTGSTDGHGNSSIQGGIIKNPLPEPPKTATPQNEVPSGR
jgi:hypothetical protein